MIVVVRDPAEVKAWAERKKRLEAVAKGKRKAAKRRARRARAKAEDAIAAEAHAAKTAAFQSANLARLLGESSQPPGV